MISPRPTLSTFSTAPPKAEVSDAVEVQRLDTVELSATRSEHFQAASHFERALNEYGAVVATHPTERKEFDKGAQQLKRIVADILYGGVWPNKRERPKLPPQARPGKPQANGGLTRSEQLISNDLVSIYRKARPHATHQQHEQLVESMHLCQSILQGRITRRDYPNYWTSSPGTLQQDAARENARWR